MKACMVMDMGIHDDFTSELNRGNGQLHAPVALLQENTRSPLERKLEQFAHSLQYFKIMSRVRG
jgi:hypothetical protein